MDFKNDFKTIERFTRKLFGTQNDRELKSIRPIVTQVNELEAKAKACTDAQLAARTVEFKQRIANGESLDSILPEAFATVREAAWRVIGQRHYDVQIIGGVTLHRGRIAEMRTGEGKTLVATLPSYLNALSGKGVHVITVNDYLARRDATQMGQIHRFLGLSTGVIVHGLTDAQRQQNYGCDITYGTNNEFGFDYLRDNMKFRLEDYVQRELNFCIVDEVDSILIDEARTPLIISGPTDDSTDLYHRIDRHVVAAKLERGLEPSESPNGQITGDYTVEEKTKTAALNERGVEKMEKLIGVQNLYDPNNIELLHHVNQALRAHVLFKRDVDYVVKDGEVLIVDEFTGRLMPGRRWSDGLHQAIEAKEHVDIENENQTLATITFQNYFRMYKKLSGMTGTADTEATEFSQIYKLEVTVIPTNRPMIRKDHADVIFKTEKAKLKNIADEIGKLHAKGQPVLVGTVSVEKSEVISNHLKQMGVRHHVLNAKQHEREADIVAQAGRKGAVTIATNMAGRGTDILLGGNPDALSKTDVGPLPKDADDAAKAEHEQKLQDALKKWQDRCAAERQEVLAAGGLFILGTERHESRRIDNQLRGRSGRQGDPGESRFYLSLDDDLMRIFGSVNIGRFMEDDLPIEHRWITKAIENAQRKVEGHNYDIRKHLLEYDDVMNEQRKIVYAWRREVLAQPSLREMVFSMTDDLASAIAEDFFPNGKLRRVDGQALLDERELNEAVRTTMMLPAKLLEKDIQPFSNVGLKDLMLKHAREFYAAKEKQIGEQTMRQLEKMILLTTIDHLWKDHLLAMDHLREGIGLQGYGQKDPLVEYKKQGFIYFEMMMNQITGDCVRKLFAVQMAPAPGVLEETFAEQDDFAGHESSMKYNITDNGELVPVEGAAAPYAEAAVPLNATQPVREPIAAQQPSVDFAAMMRARAPRQMSMGRGAMPGAAMTANAGGGGGGRASGPAPGRTSAPAPMMPAAASSGVEKVGRNDPCPCGSGKKYKKCHGA